MANRNLKNATDGITFLGRDEKTWGKDGIGSIAIDPNMCAAGTGQCPYYRDTEHDLDNDKIHLVIASFRDQLCPRTIKNIFTRAKNPKRIYVRVLQQLKPDSDLIDDAHCFEKACEKYNNSPEAKLLDGTPFDCNDFRAQVEMVTIDSGLAKGPCDARSKLSALIEHDYRHRSDGKHRLEPVDVRDYCMQTDSHMDFSDEFDNGLIAMFHRTQNDRAVLSTYVASMEQNNKDPKEVPNLCMITFTSTWRNWGTKFIRNAKKPKLTNLVWGAGMSFQKCHAELNVPYDPYLDNVFDGEETSRGIRFFTNGYDVYTPDKVLVTHDYVGHQSNPVIHTWGRNNKNQGQLDPKRKALFDDVDWSYMDAVTQMKGIVEPDGVDRINVLMGINNARKPNWKPDPEVKRMINEGRFGLGTARTLDQAYEFAGFSPVDLKMHVNKCGNLKWVPFEDRPEYNEQNDWGVDINLQRRIWNESEPLLPLPSGGSSSAIRKRALQGGGGAAVPGHSAFSHGTTYHSAGWVGMIMLLLGGFLHRSGAFKSKKTSKAL